ncbi:hypothetical protein ACLKA7_009291 [Drosophila subpalustris]
MSDTCKQKIVEQKDRSGEGKDLCPVAVVIAYEECQVCTVGRHSGSKQKIDDKRRTKRSRDYFSTSCLAHFTPLPWSVSRTGENE